MGKGIARPLGVMVSVLAVLAVVGAGALVYAYWDTIVSVVFSPIGGWIAKALVVGGKLLKFIAGAVLATAAVVMGIRKKVSGSDPADAAATAAAPPVYGPPEPPDAPAAPSAPDAPGAPSAPDAPPSAPDAPPSAPDAPSAAAPSAPAAPPSVPATS